jgi:hypothetical protein
MQRKTKAKRNTWVRGWCVLPRVAESAEEAESAEKL